MKTDKRSWGLVLGILLILTACILSYLLTKPAEADVADLNKSSVPHELKNKLIA